jgi:stearoyl-CoA desaturase (delta-9 desaturase)
MFRRFSESATGRSEALDLPVVIGIALLHIAAIVALFHFSWFAFGLFLVMHWLTSSIGISLAFHRMLAHRSFRPKRWLKLILVVIGCIALQGRPFYWVSVHRLHHVDPDGPNDPHTPRHGLGWSHLGWMLRQNTGGARREKVIRDLMIEPTLVFINRWCPLIQLLSFALIYAIGTLASSFGLPTSGISCVLWGVGLRTVVAYHSTWLVNSAAHRWGYCNFRTRDDARNLWWVGLLTYGEGWHNNHHAHPGSARIGHRWFELDTTWLVLRVFKGLNLVSHVKTIVTRSNSSFDDARTV